MRAVELARVAAQAEKLHLQCMAQRQLRRAVFGAGAAVFGLGLLCWAQVIVFFALERPIGAIWASLVLIVLNLLAALILAGVAVKSVPGPVEREAAEVRQEALGQMKQAAATAALVAPIGRFVVRRTGRRLGNKRATALSLAAMAARYLGSRS